MIATGSAGRPERWLLAGVCGVVNGGQSVYTAGRETELRGGLDSRQRALPEGIEHMADKGGRVTMEELLMLFKDVRHSRRIWLHHPSFRRASLRSPSSKRGGAAKKIPVLLTSACPRNRLGNRGAG